MCGLFITQGIIPPELIIAGDSMDFTLTSKQRELKDRITAWRKEHEDIIREYATQSEFPNDLYVEGMEQGFGNVIVPKSYGGPGGGAMEYAIIAEQVGLFQISFQLQRAVIACGTEIQKERYLPKFVDGSAVGGIAISEPETGSSLKSMDTTAVRDGNSYILNGIKSHVNLGAEATVQKVYAMTEEGLTAFLVESSNPGLQIIEKHDPIGTRYLPIYDIELDDCVVDASQMLLEPGDGYEVFFKTFNFSRIGNASEMLGHGMRSLREATRWARQRDVGENKVTEFQGIRWKIANLYTNLKAAERLRDEAAIRLNNGEDAVLETSMAKLAAANAALPATTEAMQITGAHGLYYDQPYEENFRNVKTLEVAGGSREIMRNIIADNVIPEL
jgi:alkylation response protein AidB-like acyl-CoA dehydrogenase